MKKKYSVEILRFPDRYFVEETSEEEAIKKAKDLHTAEGLCVWSVESVEVEE